MIAVALLQDMLKKTLELSVPPSLSVPCQADAQALRRSRQKREEDLWAVSVVTSGFQFRHLASTPEQVLLKVEVTLLFVWGVVDSNSLLLLHANQGFLPNIHQIQAGNLVTNNK